MWWERLSITIFSKRQRGTVDFYEIITLCLMIVGVKMFIVIFLLNKE